MTIYLLTGGILLSGILAVWFSYRQPHPGFYILKPLTTILILLIPILGRGEISLYGKFILAGLGFSLLGDIFLMLPGDRFLAGLGAFLIAHLVYIIAFTAGQREFFWIPALPILGLAGGTVLLLYRYLGKMRIPVYLYVAVISGMAWMAWSRWMGEPRLESLLAAWGGVLFMISDLILALDRFKGKFKSARTLNLLTYYAAQWLIAISVLGFN